MTQPNKLKPVEILLVEESPTDAMFAREALEYSRVCNDLHAVTDGVQAMAFLHRAGQYADVPRPDLVLLDLNLPKVDGRDVLSKINEQFRNVVRTIESSWFAVVTLPTGA